MEALSVSDEEAVGEFDSINEIDAIFGTDHVSTGERIRQRSGKSVGQVLLEYLQTLRVENNKSGTDGKVHYALVYKNVTIGTVYYFGKMGYRAWMTHAKYYGPVEPLEKRQYVTQPTAKRMLKSLGRLLQNLQFARVIRDIEWKLVK